jgi:hypothetical protein
MEVKKFQENICQAKPLLAKKRNKKNFLEEFKVEPVGEKLK